jgi:hypothetical protein
MTTTSGTRMRQIRAHGYAPDAGAAVDLATPVLAG